MKTFKIGGIHPQDYKLSAGKKIKPASLPKEVVIPLQQHIGAPAIAVVEKGEYVKVGQLIGKADGYVSANIHASVSGRITRIENAVDINGYKHPAVYIAVEGDVWDESIIRDETLITNCNLSATEIIKKIGELGIVGMGGAAFPTHVKLNVPARKKVDSLIINAVECEPYLTSDHQLMLEKGKEIIVGCKILMKALNIQQAYIGIESNKEDAIKLLSDLASKHLGLLVVPLKMKYPQGSEKQLIDAVLKRKVPTCLLPSDKGVIVQNISTVHAVYEAVQKNKPLIERVVTVTGDVKNPSNVLVRIGTPFSQLIEEVGEANNETGKIVVGGPMMGKAIIEDSIPVTKGSSGLLIIDTKNAQRKKEYECIRCGKCIKACPMGLEPYLLAKLIENESWDEAEKLQISDCIECGCCTFSCPSNRPLIDYLKHGKLTVRNMIKNRSCNRA